jgi:hypothetical protein
MAKLRPSLSFLFIILITTSAFVGFAPDSRPLLGSIARGDYPAARVPHAAINITSSLNWSVEASSGSGIAGDPWILEDLEIDCAGVGSGITVNGTTDYAVIRNCYVNASGSGAIDLGIMILQSDNVLITNCTVEHCNNNVAIVMSNNCNVTNSTLAHPASTGYDLVMDDADGVLFSDLDIVNGSILATNTFSGVSCDGVSIINCTAQNNLTTLYYINNLSIVNSTLDGAYIMAAENVTMNGTACLDKVRFNTVTHARVTACTFNVTSGDDAVVCMGVIDDLTIDDCTVYRAGYVLYAVSDTNLVMDNNTCFDVAAMVLLNTCENITLTNNAATNVTVNAIQVESCTGSVLIANNVLVKVGNYAIFVLSTNDVIIVNNTICSAGQGIYMNSGSSRNYIVNNDIRHMMLNDAINVDGGSVTYIALNYIYAPGNATNGGTPTGITLSNTDDALIENNTCVGINGTADGYGTAVTGSCVNITIRYNNYTGCFFGVAAWSGITIQYNWFKDNFNDFEEDVLGSCNFSRNYYYEYFNAYPTDVTLNTTTTELPHDYLAFHARSHYLDPPLFRNDTHPLYWAPWYPRDEVVHVQFDSVVNGQEIPLGNLRVYLDGVAITTLSPAIEHVLYRITAYDLNGHLYHDSMYNVNATGIYLQIYLDLAAQVFFAFFSTIDNFGLEFSLLKLYVNGTRVTTNAPVMLSEMSRVTIRDYANSILYNQVLNLSITGIYLDLGLAITTITFSNEYNQTIIFYLMKGSVTVSFIIPRLSSITIRLAMGDYDYEITDLEGNELETGSMTFAAGDSTSFFVVFGKVSILPPGGLPDPMGSLIVFGLITAGVLGTMIGVATLLSRPKRSSGRSTSGKHRYIIT